MRWVDPTAFRPRAHDIGPTAETTGTRRFSLHRAIGPRSNQPQTDRKKSVDVTDRKAQSSVTATPPFGDVHAAPPRSFRRRPDRDEALARRQSGAQGCGTLARQADPSPRFADQRLRQLPFHAYQGSACTKGRPEARLYALNCWQDSAFFSDRERAALAWTEALTEVAVKRAPDNIYAEFAAHFTPEEQVQLTLTINVINGWNRIAIGLALRRQPSRPRSSIMDEGDALNSVRPSPPELPTGAGARGAMRRIWLGTPLCASNEVDGRRGHV